MAQRNPPPKAAEGGLRRFAANPPYELWISCAKFFSATTASPPEIAAGFYRGRAAPSVRRVARQVDNHRLAGFFPVLRRDLATRVVGMRTNSPILGWRMVRVGGRFKMKLPQPRSEAGSATRPVWLMRVNGFPHMTHDACICLTKIKNMYKYDHI